MASFGPSCGGLTTHRRCVSRVDSNITDNNLPHTLLSPDDYKELRDQDIQPFRYSSYSSQYSSIYSNSQLSLSHNVEGLKSLLLAGISKSAVPVAHYFLPIIALSEYVADFPSNRSF